MRLSLLAVGRLKSGPERELVERYRQRIEGMGRSLGLAGLDIVELPESRARRDDDRRAEEAAALLEQSRRRPRWSCSTSAARARRAKLSPSESGNGGMRAAAGLACVIGGPDGLDPKLRQRADLVVSFGALTMPHQIVRALVAEQLYRALTIMPATLIIAPDMMIPDG